MRAGRSSTLDPVPYTHWYLEPLRYVRWPTSAGIRNPLVSLVTMTSESLMRASKYSAASTSEVVHVEMIGVKSCGDVVTVGMSITRLPLRIES
jgi:hypothetical protein